MEEVEEKEISIREYEFPPKSTEGDEEPIIKTLDRKPRIIPARRNREMKHVASHNSDGEEELYIPARKSSLP
ncbi:hypothetical protein HDU98_005692, partial [Podochytrium sp. JEL0797]